MEGVRAAMKTRHLETDQYLNRKEWCLGSGRRPQLSQDRKGRYICPCGPGCSVGIATGYGLDGSNPGGGEIFHTCPDRPWGPPRFLYNGYRVFPGGRERPGRDADPSPTSSAVGHERIKLYLCSPCGLYGLYRASVPVQV